MSLLSERLRKVETSLTPQQAMLRWMEEAHRDASVIAAAQRLQGRPDSEYPLIRMPREVEEAVRSAYRGGSREDREQAARDAVREVVFLFQLHQEANLRVVGERRTDALHLALLISELGHHFAALQQGKNGHGDVWRSLAQEAVVGLHSLREALAYLSERYFEGVDLLFGEEREDLEERVRSLDAILDLSAERAKAEVPPKRRAAFTVRASALQPAIEATALSAARLMGNTARIASHRMMGEHRDANALIDSGIAPRLLLGRAN